MPNEEDTTHIVMEKKKACSMPKSVQPHVHLAQGAGDKVYHPHQGDGVPSVGAGHPAYQGF